MAEVKVKSNGLRNELKEIRKSIDKLTEVLLLQTNKHAYTTNNTCNDSNGMCKCKKPETS